MINVHDITKMSVEEVFDRFHEDLTVFEVEFDDGILEINGCELVWDRFVWNYYNALPRDIPMLRRYSVAWFEKRINPHTPLKQCSNMYKDYLDRFEFTEWDIDDDHMNRVVYRDVINELFNFCIRYLDAYVVGADVFDLIELLNHEPIRLANEKILQQKRDPTPEEIAEVHDVIECEILNNDTLKANSWAIPLRTKSIKMPQMQMVIGPIGYCTDINSAIQPRPIRVSFHQGMTKLWEYGIESRSASIASLYNELIMPIAQYANRGYQLVCQPMRYVVREDCGSRNYKSTLITSKRKLNDMRGIWYLDEASMSLKVINGDEDHLVGTTIKHRSVITCEWNHSRSEVCAVCFGRLYRAVVQFPNSSQSNAKGWNLGHISSINLGEKNSSTVLARKHQNSTSVAAKLQLDYDQSLYLKVSEDGKYITAHDDMVPLSDIKIVLFKQQVERVHDVYNNLIDTTSPSTITAIDSFSMMDGSRDEGLNLTPVVIGSKQRKGYLSGELLDYIKEYGWHFDESQNLVVSLKHWDVDRPLVVLPQVEVSPFDFIKSITTMMFSPTEKKKRPDKNGIVRTDTICERRLDSYGTPGRAVDALYERVQEKVSVNYSHLSVICMALSAQDPKKDDYRLPYPRHKGVMVTESPLIAHNSMGMSMAYEYQHRTLSSASTYVLHRRRGHPLDTLLLSREYGKVEKVQSSLRGGDQRSEDNTTDL